MNRTTQMVELLKQLIGIQSFSREEEQAADCIQSFFKIMGLTTNRQDNNLWIHNHSFEISKPTLLLNSHIDTVRPNADWTRDPFVPTIEDDFLYGLGSNDAGGPLVSLIGSFLDNFDKDLPFNITLACTAEEEISGSNGIASILDIIQPTMAIVGEPTQCRAAIAEKGLMVIDAYAPGESGHAAKDEGKNAIYQAIEDIQKMLNAQFKETSTWLGNLHMTVTQIQAGTQHNVVPDTCHYVIDVRTTEKYPNEELFHQLQSLVVSKLEARTFRLNPSYIKETHPMVKAIHALGIEQYGSPTLSDQALMSIPSIKLGPGMSSRSHTANEFIKISEIEQGIQTYNHIIRVLSKQLST